MAQRYSEVTDIAAVFASNLAYSSTSGATTALEDIPCMGLKNLAVTVVCSTGSISAVALYGSPDGVNYMAVSGFSSFSASVGTMGHAECTGIYQYLRVQVTGTSTCDVYLYAIQ